MSCVKGVPQIMGCLRYNKIPFYTLNQSSKWGVLGTKLKGVGLASTDRNNKTTLLFTAPCPMSKSYAKVLSPRMVKLQDVS
jgi:hypothetical protein